MRDYVLGQPGAKEFIDAFAEAMRAALGGYEREGKRFADARRGLHRGQAPQRRGGRSAGGRLAEAGAGVQVTHRDLGRE